MFVFLFLSHVFEFYFLSLNKMTFEGTSESERRIKTKLLLFMSMLEHAIRSSFEKLSWINKPPQPIASSTSATHFLSSDRAPSYHSHGVRDALGVEKTRKGSLSHDVTFSKILQNFLFEQNVLWWKRLAAETTPDTSALDGWWEVGKGHGWMAGDPYENKKIAKEDYLRHLGASVQLLLLKGRNASECVPCAERTNCTGLNVERPGASTTAAPAEFVSRAQIGMGAILFELWLR